jgi:hypothetical protein
MISPFSTMKVGETTNIPSKIDIKLTSKYALSLNLETAQGPRCLIKKWSVSFTVSAMHLLLKNTRFHIVSKGPYRTPSLTTELPHKSVCHFPPRHDKCIMKTKQ